MNAEIMRVLGCLLLALCGTLSGYAMSRSYKRRVLLMGEYLRFLTQAQSVIGYTAAEAASLLEGIKGLALMRPIIDEALRQLREGSSFESAWCSAAGRFVPDKDDRELLCSFGESFGTSNISGELSKLELHKVNASRRYDELSQELKTKSRLYRTVGTFCGVLTASLLL